MTLPSVRTFPCHQDRRGDLLPVEFGELPFVPERLFVVSNVPSGTVRGGHGHRRDQQLLILCSGRVTVTVIDGSDKEHITLTERGASLHLPAGCWAEQRYDTDDASLLVLASGPYDPDDYFCDRPDGDAAG